MAFAWEGSSKSACHLFLKTCRKCCQKGSQNETEIVISDCLDTSKKNTSKLDASYNATCSKTAPKMDPKTDKESKEKHIWAPYDTTGPHCGVLGQALGVPLARKCTKIDRKHVSGHAKLVKKIQHLKTFPGKLQSEKNGGSCVLTAVQCADKTASRKFAMVASSQRAHTTGPR